MAYKITFDTKAKEIIKEVVTQGDTPEPAPASGTRLEFETLTPGRYTINCANLIALLKSKKVDIDGEITDSDNGIIFGIQNYASDFQLREIHLEFKNSSNYYIEGNFSLCTEYGSNFTTSTQLIEGEELTIEKALEAFSTVDTTRVVEIVYPDFRYAPILGIKVSGKPLTTYPLTKEEFESVIVAAPLPEAVAL